MQHARQGVTGRGFAGAVNFTKLLKTGSRQLHGKISGPDLEKIVTGHARLAWHACWNDDQVSILQSSTQLVVTSKSLQGSDKRTCAARVVLDAPVLLRDGARSCAWQQTAVWQHT